MGGALLKKWGLPEKRLTNNEYCIFKDRIIQDIRAVIPHSWIVGHAPPIRHKGTHGDLDIILGTTTETASHRYKNADHINLLVRDVFHTTPHKNSNVYTFPVDGYQVDVTVLPSNQLQAAINYTSWGDTSMLMGRIFHKMGLHFGHTGLSFWIRQGLFDADVTWSDNDHVYEKVVLTQNMRTILTLGGFDYDRWCRGFDTQEDVYLFISKSKYFNKDLFAYENLNNINRVRNRKRPMYAGFLTWLDENNPPNSNYVFHDKQTYSLIIQNQFPILSFKIGEHLFTYRLVRAANVRLNGRTLIEDYGITDGATIGRILSKLRKMLTNVEIISISNDELHQHIENTIADDATANNNNT